jgi:3-oxoacyl-[acyl-carrier-protein] synthase II
MHSTICISGIGVVSPLGIGRENYWASLSLGCDGISAVDLFDCSALACRLGGQVKQFDAASILGAKGLKYVDRLSQFTLAASALAMKDAGLRLEEIDAKKRGIVLGTAFGGLASQQEVNRERVLDGPRSVSPMKFPSTPINALSYGIPIRYQMRLANVTVSCGMCSSLEAIRYAALMLRRRADCVLLCGGAEELSFHSYHSSYFTEELAGIRGEEISCPFDLRRNGYVQGEGCALLVLETQEGLRKRNGRGLARILGYGGSFAARHAEFETKVGAAAAAMRAALSEAVLEPRQIDFIAASANSSAQPDRVEAAALAEVFGERAPEIPACAIKSMAGEGFGASGAMQAAAAILVLDRGILPPTIHCDQPDRNCGVALVHRPGTTAAVRHALVNSLDRFGNIASLVIGRIE